MRTHEKNAREEGFSVIAGIDEAGRGPLAGPVVAGAVVLPDGYEHPLINDSKKLSASRRAALYEEIYRDAVTIGIGIVDPVEIDRINILQASLLAMRMAAENLSPSPDFLLIDGNRTIPFPASQKAIVKGDSKSVSIAAASIVAKVSRDNLMLRYSVDYPEFGFSKHKGYPTKEHRQAILKYGHTPIHRASFRVRP
ncbi:MAG: ribonuclease HII [Desulfococcus sp. 4484_241]|nr:MAG: ribonuclease HII [Desulfococcus sp. 4484_241]